MREIVQSVQQVNQIMAEIAAASQEQSAGIEQVSHSITQMDANTRQNAALVEASTEATHAMGSQAAGLAEAVARFRLHDDGSDTAVLRRLRELAG
jgi:methyl-accepting chemotaxis protein